MPRTRHLKRTRSGDQRLVLQRVLHRTQAVSESVLGLLDRMCVGSFNEERDGSGVFDFLNESVFFFAKGVFVDEACVAEDVGC